MLILNPQRSQPWKGLYELEGLTLGLFVCFVPALGFVTQIFGSQALLPVASIYGGVLLFVQRRTIDWKCPRCGKAFLRAHGSGFALPFRRRCGACGLKRGADQQD